MTHLWEIDHDYYCSEGRESEVFDSFDDFIEEWGKADKSYNLLFRWDWCDSANPDYEIEQDELRLFFVMQRKGYLTSVTVKVEKTDETRVIEWLNPYLRHLMELWTPLTVGGMSQ